MQWSINHTAGYKIDYIRAFVQSQSIEETLIVYWGDKPDVYEKGKKIYGERLKTNFADNRFTLMIFNAKYIDSGNYSVHFLLKKSKESAVEAATVNVHGMFFSYCSD